VQALAGAACISPMAILVTLANAGPVPTVVYRCGLALPVLAGLAIADRRHHARRKLVSHVPAFVAGLFLAVDLVLFNHAISDLGAGIATVLGGLSVPIVAALAWVVLGERPGRRYFVTLPLVLAGIVLVSGMAGNTGLHPAAGATYAIAASAAYACFLLILRQSASPERRVAGQLFDATAGATAGGLLIGLAFGGLQLALPWRSLGWLILLALLVQVAGWLLISSSLPRLPAAIGSLLLLLQPAGAMVLAVAVLGQRPSLIQVTGAALLCGGVLAVALDRPAGSRRGAEPGLPRLRISGTSD
jgi:drug/metabolite transporter (DMT)-like permease